MGRNAIELAERYTLALEAAPPQGLAGERLSRTGGSSSEFHDRRPYQVGDDVRRIDWPAFARSDQLVVRVWREEALARVEVLLDVSRSMGVDQSKAALALDLAALLAGCARRDGCSTRVVALAERPRTIEFDELLREELRFDSRAPLEIALRDGAEMVRRSSMVVIVSDWLCPHDARELLAPVVSRASALACVQVLGAGEREPAVGAAVRLIDSEDGGERDLVLDAGVVATYRKRLETLVEGLSTECRRARAAFVSLDAGRALEQLARNELARCGLLAPR